MSKFKLDVQFNVAFGVTSVVFLSLAEAQRLTGELDPVSNDNFHVTLRPRVVTLDAAGIVAAGLQDETEHKIEVTVVDGELVAEKEGNGWVFYNQPVADIYQRWLDAGKPVSMRRWYTEVTFGAEDSRPVCSLPGRRPTRKEFSRYGAGKLSSQKEFEVHVSIGEELADAHNLEQPEYRVKVPADGLNRFYSVQSDGWTLDEATLVREWTAAGCPLIWEA